jgi:hypothetical protein
MNCSGREPAGASDDKGTLIITHEDDGTVTVRARSPDAYAESKVNLPLDIWRAMIANDETVETLKATREQLIKVRDIAKKAGALSEMELETNVVISRAWHALSFGGQPPTATTIGKRI